MSNRSYLVGLYVSLAAFTIGCLFLFGSLFAHANNKHPKISHHEMSTIIADYNFSTKNKLKLKNQESVPQPYFNHSNLKLTTDDYKQSGSNKTNPPQ